MEDKLREILQYYEDNYDMSTINIDDVFNELISNSVEVQGDSLYCEVYDKEAEMLVLIAGTKDRANMWLLKKVLKLIKSGTPFMTIFNGNSDYLLKQFNRYDLTVFNRVNNISYIGFNIIKD